MPRVFYDCSAALVELNSILGGARGEFLLRERWQTYEQESKTGKLSLSRRREHRSALIGIQWGASVPISSLACYPIPCLVSSPLYFTFLLLLSSNVVCLSYCFRYYYSISVVIICCFYVLLHSVFLLFLVVIILFHFLLSIVVIFNFFTLFIICCCY